jgi:hypothetical protein
VPSAITRLGLAAAIALALAAPGAGRAQDTGPGALEDPRAARFADVERGVFIGMEAGGLALFKTPTADRVKFPVAGEGGGSSRGVVVGLVAGVDLGPVVALSAFALGTSQRASIDYGAFDLLAAGLDLEVAFWKRADRNGWNRLFLYGHLRGGCALTHPEGLFGDSDVLIAGGLGIEYYTQLRHFSVGLQVDGVYALSAGAPGLSLSPIVRYTF